MGPQLLIDKSTLQSLSRDESFQLNSRYFVIYAQVLFLEILGDLKKLKNDLDGSRKIVHHTAEKISAFQSCIPSNYRSLVAGNLLGNDVEMKGRPVRLGGTEIVDETGRKGVFFDEDPEHTALNRWLDGDFSAAEHALAEHWRLSTRALDLEKWRSLKSILPPGNSLDEILSNVDGFCDDPVRQLENLQLVTNEAGLTDHVKSQIFQRWLDRGMPLLRNYAPYAYFCLRVLVTFFAAIANDLVGTRPTNRVDLEYLFYLPFCVVFSSNDKFHRRFAPLFARQDQFVIDGHDLKEDLGKMAVWWNRLSEPDKSEYRYTSGDHPPDIKGSLTLDIWEKLGAVRGEGAHTRITPELNEELMKKMRPILDAIKKVRRPKRES